MNRKFIDLILLFLLLGLTFFVIQATREIRSEGMQCKANPYEYGAKKAEKVTGYPLMCSCAFQQEGALKYQRFEYNSTEMRSIEQETIDTSRKNYNFSELIGNFTS